MMGRGLAAKGYWVEPTPALGKTTVTPGPTSKDGSFFGRQAPNREGPSPEVSAVPPYPKYSLIPSSTFVAAIEARIRPMTRLMMLAPPSPMIFEIRPAANMST